MIAYIKGKLVEILQEQIVLDIGYMGINVNVDFSVIERLPKKGEEVLLYTYFKVAEDSMSLYGFYTVEDLEIFKLLISVNGIGPKAGISILSSLNVNQLKMAIITGDDKSIANAKGIGKKTAQKIILELKDKISLNTLVDDTVGIEDTQVNNVIISDSIDALISLGYSKIEAVKAINAIKDKGSKDTSTIISMALKNIKNI